MLFALIDTTNDAVLEYREYAERPEDPQGKPRKWLPVEDTMPSYDPVKEVIEGPVVTVYPDKVTRVWTARPKTQEEITSEVDERVSGIDEVQFALMEDLYTRLGVLGGATPTSFRDYAKGLLLKQRRG